MAVRADVRIATTKPARCHTLLLRRWLKTIQLEDHWVHAAQELGISSKFLVANTSITMLRGDAHVDNVRSLEGNLWPDCLHVCFPGSPDTWNWVLYNLLMSLDLSADPVNKEPVNWIERRRLAAQQEADLQQTGPGHGAEREAEQQPHPKHRHRSHLLQS